MNRLAKYKLCGNVKSTISAKLLYLVLTELSDEQGNITVSQRKISETLGISKGTVQKNLKRLRNAGFVRVTPQWNPDGGQTVNKYGIR